VLRNHRIRTGNVTQFKKGHDSWNSGKRYHLVNGGTFKKGMHPKNTKHDGAITVRTDNRGVKVLHIRTALNKWEYLSRHTWREHHGDIPAGCLIVHRDGDTLNCSIENLECITKAENARRNWNRKKAAIAQQEAWENGTRYMNDSYIAKLLARGDAELHHAILQNKEMIETKRQQLILNRKLNNKNYEPPYTTQAA
jgi:hypothetical protein